jgi:hypothetical protein
MQEKKRSDTYLTHAYSPTAEQREAVKEREKREFQPALRLSSAVEGD